ncbi:MAG: ABC transporter ATP-binding protein [Desulfovibrionales bacterium]|nr:MAG: ABC transporter ATP-binding protein [Desulfovibrionales bacterium]
MALTDVDFDVREGTITALIGPNGAGKTTLLNVVSGMVTSTEGAVHLLGQDMTRSPAWKRAQAGAVRTFQNLEVFTTMNVLENVMTGVHRVVRYGALSALFKTPAFFQGERRCRELAEEKLAFVGLKGDWNLPAGELPYGRQRLLELARALAAQPRILLLDEPAAGLNTAETRTLAGLIRRVRDELGITVAIVEHDMDLIMGVSDAITVLHFGKVIASGTPAEIQKNPEVVAAYLGEEAE